MMHKEYQTVSCEEHIAIVWSKGEYSFDRGTASADHMGDGTWWINRVVVSEKSRGQGIGSHLIQLLKEEVVKQPFKKLTVVPGGYNSKKKDQENFYLKQGFIKDNEGLFIWVKTKSRKNVKSLEKSI